LNKIDNDLSNKQKRLNRMFNSILALLFLLKTLVYTNLFLLLQVLQSFAQGLFSMVIAFQRLLALSKNQQQLITNNSMVLKQNSIRIFLSFLRKE